MKRPSIREIRLASKQAAMSTSSLETALLQSSTKRGRKAPIAAWILKDIEGLTRIIENAAANA